MDIKDYRNLLKVNKNAKEKAPKYNNKKVIVDGVEFDSKKEANRYNELQWLQKAGKIKDLQRQVTFELIPKQGDERAVKYKADFVYFDIENDLKIVEDTKGFKTKDYIIKRKLMKYLYPDIKFIES